MRILKSTTSLFSILLSYAAFAQEPALRDLSVEQTTAAQIVAPHPGALSTTVFADRADATYAVGETVKLTLNAAQESYVTVLDIGPTGKVTQLFPNAYQADNKVRAGQPVEIAGASTGARITVGQPTGTELIKVITSNKPIAVIPEGQLQGAGPFRILDGGVKALTRDLSVVSDAQPAGDAYVALANFGLYTIPSRAPAAPAAVTVVIPGQSAAPAPSAHVETPAEQPFPLLLATDKSRYRIGEKATVAVTTTQPCTLTVLDFNAAGVVHTLYPAAGAANGPLAANQTVFVGGGSGPDLVMAGPAGSEQLLATCTTAEAGAAGTALPAATNAPADAVVVSRQLAVVAAKPGTAMASAIVAVTP
jgi:Domain of unknown function (DUF4384)